MAYIIILIVSLISPLLLAGVLYVLAGNAQGGSKEGINKLNKHLDEQKSIIDSIQELYASMIDLGSVKRAALELKTLQEALKAERGRITITQAELETVETRLRELEEIERELEASSIETKEELRILQKKEAELKTKNEELKTRISESISKMDEIIGKVEMSAQVEEQILAMKNQLLRTEQSIDQLLVQIEDGNQQYFILKKRYDALDIEYAQLYEKFSEADSGSSSGSDDD